MATLSTKKVVQTIRAHWELRILTFCAVAYLVVFVVLYILGKLYGCVVDSEIACAAGKTWAERVYGYGLGVAWLLHFPIVLSAVYVLLKWTIVLIKKYVREVKK